MGYLLTTLPGRITRNGPVPIVWEAGWAAAPVWTGAKLCAATGIRTPDRLARNESIYRLRHPGEQLLVSSVQFLNNSVERSCC